MTDLSPTARRWLASGQFMDCDGCGLYYQIRGACDAPWLVCFHGFPTSSWDWHRIVPELARRFRVLVFDFPGYGLSDKPPQRSYDLQRQLDAAESLLGYLDIRSFDLLAHDMGNTVACELLRRRESGAYRFDLRSLTLLNGGIYMDLHRPLLTQRLLRTPGLGALTARFSSWRVFRAQYPRVYAKPDAFDEEHYRTQWSLMLHKQGRRVLHRLAGYMRQRTRMGERWTGPLQRLDLPLQLLWGRKDPIAVAAIAERLAGLHGAVNLSWLDDSGHYPQLENPKELLQRLAR